DFALKKEKESVMNEEKSVVKNAEAAQRNPPRDLHVEIMNRNRVACTLRTVARLLRFAIEECDTAQKLVTTEIGDVHLQSSLMHFQNQLTLAELDLPDIGGMDRQIERLRMLAFRAPPAAVPEKIDGPFGAKIAGENRGAQNVRQPEGVAV
ncbi:MAG: hypothetical protein NTY53_20845, partial [Kiritimatiellaeota bacterium]|nr:hypothetical protein [Kiritimatiellota bacterium]